MRSTMETRALPHVSRPCFFVEIRLHEIDHGDKGASTTTSTSTRVEIRLHEIDHGDLVKVAAACRTATVSRSGSMRSTMETLAAALTATTWRDVEIRLHEIDHGDRAFGLGPSTTWDVEIRLHEIGHGDPEGGDS